jgi:hypothetical protein
MQVTIRPALPSDAQAISALAMAGKRYWGYPLRPLGAYFRRT